MEYNVRSETKQIIRILKETSQSLFVFVTYRMLFQVRATETLEDKQRKQGRHPCLRCKSHTTRRPLRRGNGPPVAKATRNLGAGFQVGGIWIPCSCKPSTLSTPDKSNNRENAYIVTVRKWFTWYSPQGKANPNMTTNNNISWIAIALELAG